MTGDFTRLTFRPENHYRSVRMQQGRVQLDSDWNEQDDIQAYRDQTTASDLLGAAAVPWQFGGGGFRLTNDVVARSLHGVALASDKVAIAVGDDATIMLTTDGGESWSRRPGVPVRGSTVLRAASFASPTEGLVVGDNAGILHSANGGQDWTRQNAPAGTTESLYALHMLAKRWVAVGGNGIILTTDDGGKNWTRRTMPGVEATLRGVSFADDLHGVAVGDNATILTTEDGGVTWQRRNAPAGLGETLRAVDVEGSTGVAVGDNATIIRTTDAGATWTLLPKLATAPEVLLTVRAATATRWVAAGGPSLIGSDDGGATWAVEFLDEETTTMARDVGFTTGGRGLLVGDPHSARSNAPAIVATTNGGKEWSAPKPLPKEFAISAGHMYVDGILCENARDVPFLQQPDFPGASLPTSPGTYVFYLDAWDRHVTALDRPELREVGLGGADTATRVQTVWQVRWALPQSGQGDDVSFLHPTGRLAARAVPQPGVTEPCVVPAGAGYRGVENQCYRVEVHDANGPVVTWSRDNGSIAARVVSIQDRVVTVTHPGHGAAEAFVGAPLVELTDEVRILNNQPGELIELDAVMGDTLVLRQGSSMSGLDLATAIVRRWDGVIRPAAPKAWHDVEDGVQVRLSDGTYQPGDYWTIPARTNTGDVEWPEDSGEPRFGPRHGIRHHYAPLAVWRLISGNWVLIQDSRRYAPSLPDLATLIYVGGDAQEYAPAPTSVIPIRVGITVPGGVVRFVAKSGTVRRPTSSAAPFVDISSGGQNFVICEWLPDSVPNTSDKRLIAQLVRQQPNLETAPNGFGHEITFTARPIGGTALNEVREQLYLGLSAGVGDGIARIPGTSEFGFALGEVAGVDNDFSFTGGTVIVDGRPATSPAGRYSQQRWTVPANAAADGVDHIPPLTTPPTTSIPTQRLDLVYLDVWDGQSKREVAVRVTEGGEISSTPPTPTLPAPKPGHLHLPIAMFRRNSGGPHIPAGSIADWRPRLDSVPRPRELTLLPFLQSIGGGALTWQILHTSNGVRAFNTPNQLAAGLLPLALPDGARLTGIQARGKTTSSSSSVPSTRVSLRQSRLDSGIEAVQLGELIIQQLNLNDSWDRTLKLSPPLAVDNARFSYYFLVSASLAAGPSHSTEIYNFGIQYEY